MNKTAWLYFGCKHPEAVLDRAVEQGVNVLRVSLEGQYYYETVGIELWPWGGTRNNDGVHRRKQGWLWCCAGCFWTWHSWDGCEGIDDVSYKAPGAQFLRPMADFFKALPFWELSPNCTALTCDRPDLVWATLAHPDRSVNIMYLCSRVTGQAVKGGTLQLRLPNGSYRITFQRPADLSAIATLDHRAGGLGRVDTVALPDFVDDLIVTIKRPQPATRTRIPGTQ